MRVAGGKRTCQGCSRDDRPPPPVCVAGGRDRGPAGGRGRTGGGAVVRQGAGRGSGRGTGRRSGRGRGGGPVGGRAGDWEQGVRDCGPAVSPQYLVVTVLMVDV